MRSDDCSDRTGAAAQVDDNGRRSGEFEHLSDQELGPSAGDEDARFHDDPHAGELGPADDLLERAAEDPFGDQRLDKRWIARRRKQDVRFLLREHAAGSAQTLDHCMSSGHHWLLYATDRS